MVSLLALFAPSALAAKTHPYTGTSFGPDGVGGSTTFSNLQSIAVDEASGDVFAYDATAEKVYKFDASGTPVDFSGLTGNAIESVGGGGGNGEYEIAVAPAGSPGGTAGDIYVANNSQSLRVFSAAGAPLGEIAIGGETCGVAVSPAGHVFVGIYSNEVREFVPTANPPTVGDESPTKSSGVVSGICNVAADGSGNVYTAGYSSGPISRLEGLGAANASTVDSSANTLAIDSTTNDLYANRRSGFAQYDSTGDLIGTSGAGQLNGSYGIAVNGANETVYARNNASGKVDIFGPPIVVPGVVSESATGVTGSRATLHATVNPAGLAVTDCKFEYGTDQTYGQSKPCAGAIPTDEADHPVTAELTGLAANTTYFFRTVATNANGTNQSDAQNFTTNLPAVTEEASAVSGSKATLNGKVFPEGEAVTECFFEYGQNGNFTSTAPCAESVPNDEGEHAVSAQVTGLTPNGAGYSFRLVINRAAGVARGGTSFFQTAATVVTGAPTAISPPDATLNGTVNPEGTAFTDCVFEYGRTTGYGRSVPCAESPAEIGAGTAPVPVHVDISDITFGTTYHYRLRAGNATTAVHGADEVFATPGPVIESQSAASVGQAEATLKARINPEGTATTYRIEYGTDSSYGSVTPEFQVGDDSNGHIVGFVVTGLVPNATYHYHFVATNAIGVSEGVDHTFTTPTGSSTASTCPNQALRTGYSAFLPDCRAYEMVSPINKRGGDVHSLLDLYNFTQALNQASTDGNRFTYASYRAFGDPKAGPMSNQYLAFRQEGEGWTNQAITPQQGVAGTGLYGLNANFFNEYKAFSSDLCQSWIGVAAEPLLAPGATDGYVDLYRRRNCGPVGYEALVRVEPPARPGIFEPELQGISSDGSVAVLRANAKLTPDALGGEASQAYLAENGELHLVCILPDGQPSTKECSAGYDIELEAGAFGNSALNHSGTLRHALSATGDSVFWTASEFLGYRVSNTGKIFLRENPAEPQSAISGGECNEPEKACTVPVSETVTEEPARFLRGSSDGTKALFEVVRGNLNGNLYLFDAASGSSRLVAGKSLGVAGAAEDLGSVYFASEEVLPGTTGAAAGQPNLYLDEGGEKTFIATLSRIDVSEAGDPAFAGIPSNTDWLPRFHAAQATPDGKSLVFISNRSLTGYDNTDAASPLPCGESKGSEEGVCDTEVFRYEAGSSGPVCISCNPTGARPQGRAAEITAFSPTLPSAAWLTLPNNQLYYPRVVSEDGSKIFFDSFDPLLRRDTNGKRDVYEWEAAASRKECEEGGAGIYVASSQGCLSLISSGESPTDSELVDSTPSGDDAFFTTNSSLLPQDPGLVDVYDARTNGGFPQASTPAGCEGEACQGPLSPPKTVTPASATFNGPGNLKPKARKKNKHHRRKHQEKRKQQKQRGHDNRRAGR